MSIKHIPKISGDTLYASDWNAEHSIDGVLELGFIDDFNFLGDWWYKDIPAGNIDIVDGELRFSANSGENCDWSGGDVEYSPIVMLSVPDYNWDFIVKITRLTTVNDNGIGIFVGKDRDNVYYWLHSYRLDNRQLICQKIVDDVLTTFIPETVYNYSPVWLRIRKRGWIIFFDHSNDGETWINAGTQSKIEFPVTALGIFGINWGTYPAFDNRIDWAKIIIYRPKNITILK